MRRAGGCRRVRRRRRSARPRVQAGEGRDRVGRDREDVPDRPAERLTHAVVGVLGREGDLEQVEHGVRTDEGVLEGVAHRAPDAGADQRVGGRRQHLREGGVVSASSRVTAQVSACGSGTTGPAGTATATASASSRTGSIVQAPGEPAVAVARPSVWSRSAGCPASGVRSSTPAPRSSWIRSGPAVSSQPSLNGVRSPAPARSQEPRRSAIVALPNRCFSKWSLTPRKNTSSPRRALSCLMIAGALGVGDAVEVLQRRRTVGGAVAGDGVRARPLVGGQPPRPSREGLGRPRPR